MSGLVIGGQSGVSLWSGAVVSGNAMGSEGPLSYLVPAGHYVRLVSTTSGTGSISIVSQAEETLG